MLLPKFHSPAALRRRAILACAALLMTAAASAQELRIGGTGAALGTVQLLAQAYTKTAPGAKLTVLPSMGSGGGIKAVLAGAVQLAVSSRPLTESEVKAGAVEFEYGRTPLVFATGPKNAAVDLSTQNLIDIYAGKTEQWPDGSKIRLVLRPIGDGDSELIANIAPAMREAKNLAEQRKGMAFSVTDQDAADNIETIPGAVGPSSLAQIITEKRQLKALSLNGVAPDAKALADGSYPLQKPLSIVSSPKSPAAAQAFVAFVRSAAGREILLQTGHWVK